MLNKLDYFQQSMEGRYNIVGYQFIISDMNAEINNNFWKKQI